MALLSNSSLIEPEHIASDQTTNNVACIESVHDFQAAHSFQGMETSDFAEVQDVQPRMSLRASVFEKQMKSQTPPQVVNEHCDDTSDCKADAAYLAFLQSIKELADKKDAEQLQENKEQIEAPEAVSRLPHIIETVIAADPLYIIDSDPKNNGGLLTSFTSPESTPIAISNDGVGDRVNKRSVKYAPETEKHSLQSESVEEALQKSKSESKQHKNVQFKKQPEAKESDFIPPMEERIWSASECKPTRLMKKPARARSLAVLDPEAPCSEEPDFVCPNGSTYDLSLNETCVQRLVEGQCKLQTMMMELFTILKEQTPKGQIINHYYR